MQHLEVQVNNCQTPHTRQLMSDPYQEDIWTQLGLVKVLRICLVGISVKPDKAIDTVGLWQYISVLECVYVY